MPSSKAGTIQETNVKLDLSSLHKEGEMSFRGPKCHPEATHLHANVSAATGAVRVMPAESHRKH